MSPENSQKLLEIYPELFSHPRELEPLSLFGFECDDGWFELLKECITAIKKYSEKEKILVHAIQVKEKYGSLRFYTKYCYDPIDEIIEVAKQKSSITCEECGAPGKMTKRGGWLQTLCDKCHDRT